MASVQVYTLLVLAQYYCSTSTLPTLLLPGFWGAAGAGCAALDATRRPAAEGEATHKRSAIKYRYRGARPPKSEIHSSRHRQCPQRPSSRRRPSPWPRSMSPRNGVGVTMLYVSPTVSPGRLAATRPPSHPPRVGGGGGSTPRPSVTLASPARRPVPHTAPHPLLLLHYSKETRTA